jgi:lipopolysaccharide transport protein LptA
VTSSFLVALANHLLQSTLFVVMVGCLTLLVRNNSARVRYLLWFAGSIKFLVPFASLSAVAAQIPWTIGPVHRIPLLSIAAQMTAPIGQFAGYGRTTADVAHTGSGGVAVLITCGVLWGLGALIIAARWFARWLLIRRALQESTQTSLTFAVPVRLSSLQLEPAVVGILRPVLLLPKGIEQRLTPEELRAVLAHKGCHVAWRDNLAAMLHMLVETLFWFHPLIWWLGARLVGERERACDERVLADGHLPESCAEGILKICEHYLQSRIASVAGIRGANLRQRIEGIMKNRSIERLSAVQKLLIATAASATIAIPVGVGVFISPHAHAQARTSDTEPTQTAQVLAGAGVAVPTGETKDFGRVTVYATATELDDTTRTLEYRNVLFRAYNMTVQADRAQADSRRLDNTLWTFEGNVRVQFEQGRLHSDHAVVDFRNHHIARVTVDGSPAEFEQHRENSPQVTHGHAAEIDYDVNDGTVRMTKGAWLSDGHNQISSGLLVYNVHQQKVRANGRANITISPR